MARIRLPGPLATGLAAGIPAASNVILEMAKLEQSAREKEADRVLRERALRMQEEEFGGLQAARKTLAGETPGVPSLAEFETALAPRPGVLTAGLVPRPPVEEEFPAGPGTYAPGPPQPPLAATYGELMKQPGAGPLTAAMLRLGMAPRTYFGGIEEEIAKRETRQRVKAGMERGEAAIKKFVALGGQKEPVTREQLVGAIAEIGLAEQMQGREPKTQELFGLLKDKSETDRFHAAFEALRTGDTFDNLLSQDPGKILAITGAMLGTDSTIMQRMGQARADAFFKQVEPISPEYAAASAEYLRRITGQPNLSDREKLAIYENIGSGLRHEKAKEAWAKHMPPSLKGAAAETSALEKERLETAEYRRKLGDLAAGRERNLDKMNARELIAVKTRLTADERLANERLGAIGKQLGGMMGVVLDPDQKASLEEERRILLERKAQIAIDLDTVNSRLPALQPPGGGARERPPAKLLSTPAEAAAFRQKNPSLSEQNARIAAETAAILRQQGNPTDPKARQAALDEATRKTTGK